MQTARYRTDNIVHGLALHVRDDPRLVPKRRDRLVVALPVRPHGRVPVPLRLLRPLLRVAARGPRARLEVARERREAHRARAVPRRVREERLAVREDRLEVRVARGRRVRARADLRGDRLEVRAALLGRRGCA